MWRLPLQVVNYPEGTDSIRLDDYRGKKLIVLDFWATWCGTCLELFPKLQLIKTRFADDLLLLPATAESKEIVTAKMTSPAGSKRLEGVFSVVNAEILTAYFPFRTLPHVVIIKNNRVYSITYGSNISMDAIGRLLDGKTVEFLVKSDMSSFNDSLALLENGERIKSALLFNSTLIKNPGGLPGSGSLIVDYTGQSLKYSLLNRSLFALYQQTMEPFLRNRIVLAVKDKDRFRQGQESSPFERKQWRAQNTYSYELIAPKDLPMAEIRKLMRSDLDRYLSFVSAVEERQTQCYVIEQLPDRKDKPADKNDSLDRDRASMNYGDFLFWVNYQSPSSSHGPIVIDETNLDNSTAITVLRGFVDDVAILEQTLAINGLRLVKTERPVEFCVIRDQNENK